MKFSIQSNAQRILKEAKEAFLGRADVDRLCKQAAFDIAALIQNRVQQKGENTTGQQMSDYLPSYARYRSQRGRQTRVRDLTLTGDMFRDYGVARIGTATYAVGFFSRIQADKARMNEMREGVIFDLSENEIDLIAQSVIDNATNE